MPMWTCDIENCSRPALRALFVVDCNICNRRLCTQHAAPGYHKCPPYKDRTAYDAAVVKATKREIEKMLSKINISALTARASTLRNGIPCFIPESSLQLLRERSNTVMGGLNFHLQLSFEDGVAWMVRVKRFNVSSPPPALRDHIMCSEVATMRFLAERTGVPVPKVYDFALEGDGGNEVGVGYIMMEKLAGSALQYKWPEMSTEQKTQILDQLADIFIEFGKHTFDKCGALFPDSPRSNDPGSVHIGPLAAECWTDFDDTTGEMLPLGPYSSPEELPTAHVKLNLNLIRRQELYPRAHALDAYLAHRFILDLVPRVFGPQDSNLKDDGSRFFIKHADDKGDHILIDEALNITGIIDWEYAYTAPARAAFILPYTLIPADTFFNGVTAPSEDEVMFADILARKGAGQIGESVRNGRAQQLFWYCVGMDFRADWEGFKGLFKGLRGITGVDAGLEWEEWKEVARERYADDQWLKEVLARQMA